MSVIPLTIFFSLLLAGLFIVLFAREQRTERFGGAERDSLLPLADETPRTVPEPAHHERHEHADCGCRSGRRAPCAGCLKSTRIPHSTP